MATHKAATPAVRSKAAAARRGPKRRPSSTKLAVSFESRLADQVQRAARRQAAGNVSAWLAAAAREHLRLEAARALLREHEATHGRIPAASLAEVEREWPAD